MQGMLQDLRYATRILIRAPGFSIVAVLALTLGIGANTAVFTIVHGVLLRPLPYPQPDRLFLLSEAAGNESRMPMMRLSDRSYLEVCKRNQLLEGLATFDSRGVGLTGAGEPVHLSAGTVAPDFVRILGVKPAIGRTFTAEDVSSGAGQVVVLGDALWRERFAADRNVVGAKVKLDGIDHTVIGVMPPGFTFPEESQLWIPLKIELAPHLIFARPVVGRLKHNVSRKQAQAEMQSILGPGRIADVRPFQDLVVSDARRALLIFAGAVGFVLLIACANVANLLLIRAASRQQEMAVRAALGASANRITRQLLTESSFLALIAGAGGVLLASWGVPFLLALAPQGTIPRIAEIHMDRWALWFTFGVSLLTGILFGLAPRSHIVRRPLRDSINGNARAAGGRGSALRGALTTVELALALVLLSGAGLMVKSFLRMRAVDPGFRPENVITMTLSLPDSVYHTPAAKQDFQARLLRKLTMLGGVTAAGVVDLPPMGEYMLNGSIRTDGRRLPPNYSVDKPCVSPGYFGAMGIRLLRGRDFTLQDDVSAPGVVIVSQSVAHEVWPGENPIGKRLTIERQPHAQDWLVIVGVVEDIRQYGPRISPGRAVYRPYAQSTAPTVNPKLTFVARTMLDPLLVAPALRYAVYEVDPNQPVESVTTMQDRITESIAKPLFQTRLLTGFSLMALLLAAIGIYGVVGYSVTERTHEIGIRMALGASRGDVMRDVVQTTMVLAAIGIALGTALTFVATRVLSTLLFEVKPTDPTIFVSVAVLLAAVAGVASWIPARRATLVDPAVALRYE